MIFGDYADYYDLLYRDKNYQAESEYVLALIKNFSLRETKSLLDAGCGTGNHTALFSKSGLQVTGIDASEKMIRIARQKSSSPEYRVADMTNFSLGKKFDAAVSLFDVMNYFVTDESLEDVLKNIYSHLIPGGIFIFDSWYGPSVLAHRPEKKIKECETADLYLTRIAEPRSFPGKNCVDVTYHLTVRDKKTGLSKSFDECHSVRYFFEPKIRAFLEKAGYEYLGCREWMTDKVPDENSWNVVFISRKKP